MAAKHELLDHTGDVGLRIWADTLPELFAEAAHGMFELMLENLSAVRPIHRREVLVRGSDLEELFVNWLSELNFLFSTEGELLSRFRIHEVTEQRVKAQVAGERLDPLRHEIRLEIKAVTFHNLYVGPARDEPDGWEAQVIFDI